MVGIYPGPYLVPVSRYFGDPTQGLRAAISTFPATLVRHYRAPTPDGGWFTQESRGRRIELLATACGEGVAPFGYLTGHGVEAPSNLADRLEAEWTQVRVGTHWDLDVVRGYDWDGVVKPGASRIALVTTSTAAGGLYGADRLLGPVFFERVTRGLLTAAYSGTLLAAAAAKRQWVILTLIGGGAFGNPIHWVLESLIWALEEVEGVLQTDLHVVLNGRDLSDRMDLESGVLPAVRRWSGRICQFSENGLEVVLS